MGATSLAGYLYLQTQKPQNIEEPKPTTTPTPTPIPVQSNWKTYYGTDVNGNKLYSINYPGDWKEIEHSSNFYNTQSFQTQTGTFSIEHENKNNTTLEKYLSDKDKSQESGFEGYPSLEILSSKKVKVGVFQAIKREEKLAAAGLYKTVAYLETPQYIIVFSADPPYSTQDLYNTEANKYFDQILSTFKFLDVPSRELIPALSIYKTDQLNSYDKDLLKNFQWPKLKQFKSQDTTREVYLIDCQVTNDQIGINLIGNVETVPNIANIAETTMKKLLEKHYGEFPDKNSVIGYEQASGLKFKNRDSGINGVILKSDGTLAINFFDSVQSYGGGSSRVACMSSAVRYTMLQFPTIKHVQMCIDKYPSEKNDCSYDFQP